jgi:hypothetical protein
MPTALLFHGAAHGFRDNSGSFAKFAAIRIFAVDRRPGSSSKARRRPEEMANTKLSAGPHLVQPLSVADCCSQIRGAVRRSADRPRVTKEQRRSVLVLRDRCAASLAALTGAI